MTMWYITVGITFRVHNILPYACCMCIGQPEDARINWLENGIHNLRYLLFGSTAAADTCIQGGSDNVPKCILALFSSS